MNVSQLKQEVIQLGFESAITDEAAFLGAANRAVAQLNLILPLTARFELSHKGVENLLPGGREVLLQNGTELVYTAGAARAYYFQCDGNGSCAVEKLLGSVWQTVSVVALRSTNCYKEYKGIIDQTTTGNIRLRFYGDYSFNVRNVALYGRLLSSSAEDIVPFSEFREYHLPTLIAMAKGQDDYLGFYSLTPQQRLLRYGQDYIVNGDTLLLSNSFSGVVEIVYKRIAPRLTMDDAPTTAVPVNENFQGIIALLVASYIWLEDSPDKAQYYAQLYREALSSVMEHYRKSEQSKYKCYSGWA